MTNPFAGPLPVPPRLPDRLRARGSVGWWRGFVERLDPLGVSVPGLTGRGAVSPGTVEVTEGLDLAVGDRVWVTTVEGDPTALLIAAIREPNVRRTAAGAVGWVGVAVGAGPPHQGAAAGAVSWDGVIGSNAGLTRPQLRVYAPASVTGGGVVPFASVRRDSHGPYAAGHYGWDSTNYRYYVPVSGLYLVNLQWKVLTAVESNWALVDFTTAVILFAGPNSSAAANHGGSLSGTIDLTQGQVLIVKELTSSYTPSNDATSQTGSGSNYFHLTYLGPTT